MKTETPEFGFPAVPTAIGAVYRMNFKYMPELE
jgi:hypothetical protein